MTRYVVDASVGIKWFVPEIHSEAARHLINIRCELLVPDLFFPEIGNILWKRVRRGEDTAENARQTYADLRLVPMQVYESVPLASLALEIALHSGRTVYDSLYLSLAILKQCSMITADLKLFNALKNSALASNLTWIEAVI
ncbi:MAG: type II toxin-antitoxin system VapC family toxin [Cyanobacteria bacterium J06635_1]